MKRGEIHIFMRLARPTKASGRGREMEDGRVYRTTGMMILVGPTTSSLVSSGRDARPPPPPRKWDAETGLNTATRGGGSGN
jgi:hypothetical protein